MLVLGSVATVTSCLVFYFCSYKPKHRKESRRLAGDKSGEYQRVESVSSIVDHAEQPLYDDEEEPIDSVTMIWETALVVCIATSLWNILFQESPRSFVAASTHDYGDLNILALEETLWNSGWVFTTWMQCNPASSLCSSSIAHCRHDHWYCIPPHRHRESRSNQIAQSAKESLRDLLIIR